MVLQPGLPNGVWTIEGPRGHRTFRVSTIIAPKDQHHVSLQGDSKPAAFGQPEGFRERHAGKRVLELLVGPDNTSSYRGLAWIEEHQVDMYQMFKNKVPFDQAVKSASSIGKLWKFGQQPPNEILCNIFSQFVIREKVVPGYTVHFSKNCLKCNRLLTTPESIKRGIGPICARGGWD